MTTMNIDGNIITVNLKTAKMGSVANTALSVGDVLSIHTHPPNPGRLRMKLPDGSIVPGGFEVGPSSNDEGNKLYKLHFNENCKTCSKYDAVIDSRYIYLYRYKDSRISSGTMQRIRVETKFFK